MEKFYSSIGLSIAAETKIKYGKEEDFCDTWQKIISIDNEEVRKQEIDKVISLIETNKENNGFISRDEVVEINKMGNSFKIDDNELYYLYFETLKLLAENNPNEPNSRIIFYGVLNTVKNYFGGFNGNRSLRMSLTSIEIDDDDVKIPSISAQRGKNCSLCVERASVAHNLWLLAGEKSHYINSLDCDFGESENEYLNDGHAFCIIETEGVYKLFDPTMQIYKKLEINPINKMLNGESFEISTKDGETYVYANASKKRVR